MSKKELRRLIEGNKPEYPLERTYLIKDPAHTLLIWNELIDRYNSIRNLRYPEEVEALKKSAMYLIDLYEFIEKVKKSINDIGSSLTPHVLENCYFSVCMTTQFAKYDGQGAFRLKIIIKHVNLNSSCYILSDPVTHKDMQVSSGTRFIRDPAKESFWHIYKTAFTAGVNNKYGKILNE